MAKLSLQAFKDKWAALQGRFKTNFTFDIDEDDYREFSLDIADSVIEPVELLAQRVEKLENPAPVAKEGVKWSPAPKVSVEGNDVVVTPSAAQFNGVGYTYDGPVAKEDVVLPPDGFGTRIDILGASAANNGWVYIYGEEPGVTPRFQHPDQPDAELLFAAYLHWTSTGGGTVEQPAVVVKVVEIDGTDYTPDPSGRVVLPKQGGTTINSTDDILQEGATNKWFTDARVYLGKASNYVIQGTTRAITTSDTLGMILGIFENRLNVLAQSISNVLSSLSGYVQKAAEREVASTGSIALTLDRDAFIKCSGTTGQLTGNLSITFTGGVKGVEQVFTFKSNGSATVSLPSGATNEGSKPFNPAVVAVWKLWVRCGQDETGALKYFYLWV